jgi:hypothetical protein
MLKKITHSTLGVRAGKILKLCGLDIPYRILQNLRFKKSIPNIDISNNYKKLPSSYSDQISTQPLFISEILNHNIDVLGSGLVNIDQKKIPQSWGLKIDNLLIKSSKYYRYKSQLPVSYSLIDWQKDYKSGYRWQLHKSGAIQHLLSKNISGVDIKVPWEIGRLQHLPILALGACFRPADSPRLIDEINNQVTDFALQNPVGSGVQWACTMDVAIRVANIVLAKIIIETSIPTKQKLKPSDQFNFFNQLIFDHGKYIVEHLEWNTKKNGNHYLANVAGLLFVACYLNCPGSDEWLLFAINEIVRESDLQFHPDGVNYEGSTSYHCLTTEILLFSFALICGMTTECELRFRKAKFINYPSAENLVCVVKGLSIDQIKQRLAPKVYNTLKFVQAITRPDNAIAQIGDNDSGRFFKLGLRGRMVTKSELISKYANINISVIEERDEYFDEETLDHTHLNAGLAVFFNEKSRHSCQNTQYILSLLSNSCNCLKAGSFYSAIDKLNRGYLKSFIQNPKIKYQIFKSEKNLLEDLVIRFYEHSGYVIVKGKYLYMLIVCSNIAPVESGGHHHNDKLSFDLWIDGKDQYRDPGSYVYTADVPIRNKYRSTGMHNTIKTSCGEQNEFTPKLNGLFSMNPTRSKSFCYQISENAIGLECCYKNVIHQREITIASDQVLVTDYCNLDFTLTPCERQFSPGYGKLLR